MTTLLGKSKTRKSGIIEDLSPLVAVTHRWLNRMGHLARRPVTIYIIAIGVAFYGLVQRSSGLGRSLWLDEAWVANSVTAPSLKAMFYYDAWLQTSPPLFLLLVRSVVSHLGPSNTVFRLIPFLMGIVALVSMLVFALRTLSRQYALLAWTLLALSPVAVDYSKELKQYSSELAVSSTILLVCSLYIENATAQRFRLLVGTVVIGLLVGYATAFVLPGLILLICMTPPRPCSVLNANTDISKRFIRSLLFLVAAGAVLMGEYFLLIRPNSPTALRAYSLATRNVKVDSVQLLAFDGYRLIRELPLNHLLQGQGLLLNLAGIVLILGISLAWLRFRTGRRKWFLLQIFCLLPCLLLIVSDLFSWYPFTVRTTAFTVPFVIFLIVSSVQLIYFFVLQERRDWIKPILDIVFLCAVAITINASRRSGLNAPREDMDGAVSLIRANIRPGDFLWVHASCREAFKLYTKIDGWHDPPAHYGSTGWPCCARQVPNTLDTFGESLVRSDFGSALPIDFRGKVWLLYTMRAEHWLGKPNEPQFMQTILRERGCIELPTRTFTDLGVPSFNCNRRTVTTPVGLEPSGRLASTKAGQVSDAASASYESITP
jgi:hypothetical protein